MRRITAAFMLLMLLAASCGTRTAVPDPSDKPSKSFAPASPEASQAPSPSPSLPEETVTAEPPTPAPDAPVPTDTPGAPPPGTDEELERILSDIALLCETNRLSGTPGEIAALEYAEKTFMSLGLETARQKVVHSGERIFETFNVIGTKKSSVRNAPIVILCAHADNAAKGVGATDNAAGFAVMLEAARQTALLPDDAAEVRYIAFSAEEYALFGSSVYVSSLSREEKSRVTGVLNLDMFSSKNADSVYAYFENNEVGYGFWNRLIDAAEAAGIEIILSRTHEIGSDSIPFEKAGMPAVLLTHNVVKDEYHKVHDTPDKVDEIKLRYALDLCAAWLGSELRNY